MEKSRDDGFKWFGEGFDGFPKILPEDCVEYTLFAIDSNLKDFDTRDRLRQVQLAAAKLTKDLLKDFIWQRDPFKLTLQRDAGRSYLNGRTNYADSVDDEWLIVYVLRELSKEFADVWIRVVDSDGQFLLIEAANTLPIWLNPEIADFRVWINNGKLLVIPVEEPGGRGYRKDTRSDSIGLDDALKWIENPDRRLQHSAKIEAEAFFRLRKYPQQIQNSLHHAILPVPRKLAYVLHNQSTSISAAIEAFYLRDPIALEPLRRKDADGLVFDPGDLVNMSTTSNKIGYAQLRSQQFSAPPSWAIAIRDIRNAKLKPRIDIGMKLSCGFEMLLSDKQNEDRQVVREINLLLEDLAMGEARLPSDEEVQAWGLQDDDESWLDIDFSEFEKELDGKARQHSQASKAGFGDKATQENLQKIVERFEGLLVEDDVGADDSGFIDEMDNDDDAGGSDDLSSSSEEGLDEKVNDSKPEPSEDEFTAMMRELMGMPPEVLKEVMTNSNVIANHEAGNPDSAIVPGGGTSQESSEDGDEPGIQEAMRQTEQELREAGALEL